VRLLGLTAAVQQENVSWHWECYGDASHWCNVVIIPSCIHFGPTGDDLDRSGDKQRGHNDHGEYVTHGKPLLPHPVGMGRLRQGAVTVVTKLLFFVDAADSS
jgi:hypothetical protein